MTRRPFIHGLVCGLGLLSLTGIPAIGATKMVAGKALPVVNARLKISDFDKTIDATDDMLEAKFIVPLNKGKHHIHTKFMDKVGKGFGVHYLYVKRR